MKKTTLLAFAALTSASLAQQPSNHMISMVFTDTDASLALMAISMRTGANIVYANKTKIPITLKLAVNTTEEAVRSVSSSAGLVYRRVGTVFVVSASTGMKDALAPYTHTSTYQVEPGTSEQIVQRLQAAMPYVTAQASGDRVTINAVNEDVQEALSIIRSVRTPVVQRVVRTIVMMHQMPAEEAAPLIKGFYPGLTVTNTEGSKGGATAAQAPGTTPDRWARESRGAIGLLGPEEVVAEAKRTLEQLDSTPEGLASDHLVYSVYTLKYANGSSVETFLKRVAPEIDVFVSPEQFSPKRGDFNPLSATLGSGGGISSGSSAGGSSGGTGGSGGGSSTSSGGSSGGSTSGSGSGSAGGSQGGSTGSTSTGTSGGNRGDRSKAIVLKGHQADVDRALKLVADLDVKPQQVIIEVNVLETSPTDSEQIGLGYNYQPINFYDVPAGTVLNTAGMAIAGQTTRPLGTGTLSHSPINFQAILSALVTHQKAKILAKPSIQVIDNDPAWVFIGDTVRVQLNSAGPLGTSSQSVAEFPVGIILLITPRINSDGLVTMHVNPVISSISSVDANGIPQTSAREADTTVIVKDGETIVLGGLIRDQETRTTTQVPILSQIPILGELFKSRNHSRTRSDIVVSITTHIVKDAKPEGS